MSCGSDDDSSDDDAAPPDDTSDDTVSDDTSPSDDSDDDTSDDTAGDDDSYWTPHSVVPIETWSDVRGYKIRRGIIHLHSVYSHDACDNMPFISDHPNWNCLAQLREALCSTDQQYVMLTDHASPFSNYEFPDVLLYQEEEGDELVYDGDEPIANIIPCPDGNPVTLMAGNENDMMPLHLHRMPDGTPAEREALLGASDAASILTMQSLGAKVIVNHAELWETEDLAARPIDGIEVYNLHANIDPDGADWIFWVNLVVRVLQFILPRDGAGDSELILLAFFEENAADIEHWDRLLALRPTIGVMATDAHRNALPFPLWDGDRADSYRRMMHWFSNYILARDDTVEEITDAIDNGRLFGAFQLFGEPVGFDYYADAGSSTFEMGETASLADSPFLHVKKPEFYNMDPTLPAPEMKLRIIKAGEDGGTVVAEETDASIDYEVTEPGVYRAEVRVTPYHLEKWLGNNADLFIQEYPLIYANAITISE